MRRPPAAHAQLRSATPREGLMQREFVTAVSGVPRSGTSLVMQMLDAGRLPVFSDDVREPDAAVEPSLWHQRG